MDKNLVFSQIFWYTEDSGGYIIEAMRSLSRRSTSAKRNSKEIAERIHQLFGVDRGLYFVSQVDYFLKLTYDYSNGLKDSVRD